MYAAQQSAYLGVVLEGTVQGLVAGALLGLVLCHVPLGHAIREGLGDLRGHAAFVELVCCVQLEAQDFLRGGHELGALVARHLPRAPGRAILVALGRVIRGHVQSNLYPSLVQPIDSSGALCLRHRAVAYPPGLPAHAALPGEDAHKHIRHVGHVASEQSVYLVEHLV